MRSDIDDGTPSTRGARDQVQMIAASQGAPKRSESERPDMCPVCQQQSDCEASRGSFLTAISQLALLVFLGPPQEKDLLRTAFSVQSPSHGAP
jgi:hypothetical protein